MTETKWLTAREPWEMLNFVRAGASKRKLRLFTCACCRQVLNPFAPALVERALDAAEAFADGRVSAATLTKVRAAVRQAFSGVGVAQAEFGTAYFQHLSDACDWAFDPEGDARGPGKAAKASARAAVDRYRDATGELFYGCPDELANQTELLRDIFGNPFQSVGLEVEWLTETVLAVARGIYADRTFDQLPILADALQDAGCDEENILDHCRNGREHVRGCWAVDLLLGKS